MTDRELLQSISDIIIGKIGTITDNMATKEDLSNMATKEDLLWSSFFVTLRPNFHYRSYTLP